MARSPNNMRIYNDIRPIVVEQTNRESGIITYVIITMAQRYCNVVVQLIRHNNGPETTAYNTLSSLTSWHWHWDGQPRSNATSLPTSAYRRFAHNNYAQCVMVVLYCRCLNRYFRAASKFFFWKIRRFPYWPALNIIYLFTRNGLLTSA